MSGCVVCVGKAVDDTGAVQVGLLNELTDRIILIGLNAAVRSAELRQPSVAVVLVIGRAVVPVNNTLESSGGEVGVADDPAACIFQSNEISEGIIAVLDYISSEISIFCHPVHTVVFTICGVAVLVRHRQDVAVSVVGVADSTERIRRTCDPSESIVGISGRK